MKKEIHLKIEGTSSVSMIHSFVGFMRSLGLKKPYAHEKSSAFEIENNVVGEGYFLTFAHPSGDYRETEYISFEFECKKLECGGFKYAFHIGYHNDYELCINELKEFIKNKGVLTWV